MGDRSGGREPKGASLKKSKKNPGAAAARGNLITFFYVCRIAATSEQLNLYDKILLIYITSKKSRPGTIAHMFSTAAQARA
jgi:hypothetical protein